MDKELKCYYCNKEGIEQMRIVVDVDVDHDGDDWRNIPLYSDEWLCEEHLAMEEEGLMNDERGE